jgi:ABC-2 type transport system permease protein
MQAYLTMTRRELAGFFVSFMGYVVIAVAVFLMGLSFVSLLAKLAGDPTTMPITEVFYNTAYFWFILLFSAPIITMRLFSLEKFSGTFETLMTAPVSDLQVVLAKFTAALICYLVMWLPLLGCTLILRYFTSDPSLLDAGAMGGTFFGIFLLGTVYMALGCFASALTHSQIIAAMTSFAMGLSLFILSFLADQLPLQKTWLTDVLNYV